MKWKVEEETVLKKGENFGREYLKSKKKWEEENINNNFNGCYFLIGISSWLMIMFKNLLKYVLNTLRKSRIRKMKDNDF